MFNTTSSRLTDFFAGLALAAGAGAAIGAATGATPPFQDCLRVAAGTAGYSLSVVTNALRLRRFGG